MIEETWIRTFTIDGKERYDATHRTALVEHYTVIEGRTFLDLGAGDGFESRALALRGAARTVAVEGKDERFREALWAKAHLEVHNQDVVQLDVRRIDEHDLGVFDVVLCFGLLYHMENPFNMLKRIRRVTGDLLLLETHVAPPSVRGIDVQFVPYGLRDIELDGALFRGKVMPHPGEHARTKGSLDAPWSFWLTLDSLVKAVVWAGFRIEDIHHEPDASTPEVIRTWGGMNGFGRTHTKAWIVASSRDVAPEPGEPIRRLLPPSRSDRAAGLGHRALMSAYYRLRGT
jgi:SAM-dependent methyltransferase